MMSHRRERTGRHRGKCKLMDNENVLKVAILGSVTKLN